MSIRNRWLKYGAPALVALSTAPAFAVGAIDYSTVTTAATGEVASAVTAGIAVFSAVFIIGLSLSVYKKFRKG